MKEDDGIHFNIILRAIIRCFSLCFKTTSPSCFSSFLSFWKRPLFRAWCSLEEILWVSWVLKSWLTHPAVRVTSDETRRRREDETSRAGRRRWRWRFDIWSVMTRTPTGASLPACSKRSNPDVTPRSASPSFSLSLTVLPKCQWTLKHPCCFVSSDWPWFHLLKLNKTKTSTFDDYCCVKQRIFNSFLEVWVLPWLKNGKVLETTFGLSVKDPDEFFEAYFRCYVGLKTQMTSLSSFLWEAPQSIQFSLQNLLISVLSSSWAQR